MRLLRNDANARLVNIVRYKNVERKSDLWKQHAVNLNSCSDYLCPDKRDLYNLVQHG